MSDVSWLLSFIVIAVAWAITTYHLRKDIARLDDKNAELCGRIIELEHRHTRLERWTDRRVQQRRQETADEVALLAGIFGGEVEEEQAPSPVPDTNPVNILD
jgi:hypothetical protein